jgi:hypothetical protein
MNAVLIDRNAVFDSSAEKHSVTALGAPEHMSGNLVSAYIQAGKASVQAFLIRLIEGIGRGLERHRQADVERLSKPLSLDEAWTGGWYERSRLLQKGLSQGSPNTAQSPKLDPKNWDDRLD